MEPPSWKIDKMLMKAEQRTQFSHWCAGRYWADKAQLSPTFAEAIATLKNATMLGEWPSPPASAAVAKHAAVLGLKLVSASEHGVLVQPLGPTHSRLKEAARTTAMRQDVVPPVRGNRLATFRADCAAGQHTCRVFARKAALQKCSPARHGVEGMDDVDVEVLSDSRWKKWQAQLSEDQRHALRHWRAGVVAAPSRQQSMSHRGTDCPYCSQEMASARHLWAECPKYDRLRAALQEEYGLDAGWWKKQPRVTAKSGWITYAAAMSSENRLKALLAANRLGIVIVQGCWKYNQSKDMRKHEDRPSPRSGRH